MLFCLCVCVLELVLFFGLYCRVGCICSYGYLFVDFFWVDGFSLRVLSFLMGLF